MLVSIMNWASYYEFLNITFSMEHFMNMDAASRSRISFHLVVLMLVPLQCHYVV
jgi:hypothetical protein